MPLKNDIKYIYTFPKKSKHELLMNYHSMLNKP